MTIKELGRTPENQDENSEVRVYPMGFIPDVKRQLLESAERHQLEASQKISEIGVALRGATRQLASGEISLMDFIELTRVLDEFVKDGEKTYEAEREFITHTLRTDEEIAVIFAKISRNPGSFSEIAKSVTEEGAAQFHQKWVVSVEGYGHASVAEHAIIHMAVENIPSLDGDWVTDNRLGSYTEFSARFKGRQEVGYFTPDSVTQDPVLASKWHRVHQKLFATFDSLMEKGLAYIQTDEAKQNQPQRRLITKTVADQFKDLMPGSRLTSIGVTMNARETEAAISKMLSAPYPSVQKLGALFKEQSLKVAPTLVKYAARNEYMVAARRGIGQIIKDLELATQDTGGLLTEREKNLVDLIDFDKTADEKFIAAVAYSDPQTGSLRDLLADLAQLPENYKRQVFEQLLGQLGKWDVPIRELEVPGDYLVEFPGMTYGVWREYHRHRMQFAKIKDPDVGWGFLIPSLAWEMDESQDPQFHGCVEAINQVLGEVANLFHQVYQVDPFAAHYAVTRLHYRPAIAKFNIREAFHLIELRTGPTAHPFIRRLMWSLFDELREANPILMDYLRFKMDKKERPDRNFPWTF